MHNDPITITIVGAGASGCFCAAQLHEALPGADIRIFEAGSKPLAKLALTGGGRCNISNDFSTVRSLAEVYPRGSSLMKRALAEFSTEKTLEWFKKIGVGGFVTEEGGRIFPASQDAMEVVRALKNALCGVEIICNHKLTVLPDSDVVVLTTGGGPGMDILKGLPVETLPPVPSLFTFNVSDKPSGVRSEVTALMGLSVDASLSIPGSGLRSEGPLLITDWGFSGPAALRLSAYAARYLAERSYRCPLNVRWASSDEASLRTEIHALKSSNPNKLLKSVHPEGIPSRLWEYLLDRTGVRDGRTWSELGPKWEGRLVQTLLCDSYHISGKTRFREEFVTCGGVALSSVNLKTMECKERPGLYFAGEILDVDAVTGGFNLQAAWSTAHMAAKTIISKYGTQIR